MPSKTNAQLSAENDELKARLAELEDATDPDVEALIAQNEALEAQLAERESAVVATIETTQEDPGELAELRAELNELRQKLNPAPATSEPIANTRTASGRAAKAAGYKALADQHTATAKDLEVRANALEKTGLDADLLEARRLRIEAKSHRGAAQYRLDKLAILKNQE